MFNNPDSGFQLLLNPSTVQTTTAETLPNLLLVTIDRQFTQPNGQITRAMLVPATYVYREILLYMNMYGVCACMSVCPNEASQLSNLTRLSGTWKKSRKFCSHGIICHCNLRLGFISQIKREKQKGKNYMHFSFIFLFPVDIELFLRLG